jgi:DNA invertase Pin-like site-specific DNA recombinase
MATFAEYVRELIQERVQAGVDAAKARGVKFGSPTRTPRKSPSTSGR